MHSLPLRESGFSTLCPLCFFPLVCVCGQGWGEGGGAGRVKEALKERSVLSHSQNVSSVLTLVC